MLYGCNERISFVARSIHDEIACRLRQSIERCFARSFFRAVRFGSCAAWPPSSLTFEPVLEKQLQLLLGRPRGGGASGLSQRWQHARPRTAHVLSSVGFFNAECAANMRFNPEAMRRPVRERDVPSRRETHASAPRKVDKLRNAKSRKRRAGARAKSQKRNAG